MVRLSLVTPPAVECLTTADLKAHLRVTSTDEDAAIARLIKVTRQRAEISTRRAFITQVWNVGLDNWPQRPDGTGLPAGGWVELPKPNLQSILSVTYVDLAGVTQTWDPSNYLVDYPAGEHARKGRLALGWVKVWPIIRPVMNAITIQIRCGYGDDASFVPDILMQGMLLDAGTLFDIRSSVLTGARAAAIEIPHTSIDIYRMYRAL